jgi:acetyl-CoA synthetase
VETTSSPHIEGLLSTGEVIPPPPGVSSWFPIADQDAFVAGALRDPITFWRDHARNIVWETEPQTVLTGTIDDQHWFPDGQLNATVSCLDRHAAHHPDAVAYRYVCENGDERTFTYAQLLARVNQLANALRLDGVAVGDRIIIYMPLTIEGIVAMLACARIGAIHSVVYAGLGATALRDRIADAGATVVIVGDVTYRRGKAVALKPIVDDAVRGLELVRRIVVHRREASAEPADPREVNFEAYCDQQGTECEPEIVGSEHPLFILYTSGTTGKPKGVVMTHGGYLVGASSMLALTTGITPDDVYWCTSDIGWIVGHSIMVYGALANRYHCVLREGSADYPAPDAVYAEIARLKVTQFYTAPTLARMLLRLGGELAAKHDLTSLKAMYCAGEPLNPEAWRFLYEAVAISGGRRSSPRRAWASFRPRRSIRIAAASRSDRSSIRSATAAGRRYRRTRAGCWSSRRRCRICSRRCGTTRSGTRSTSNGALRQAQDRLSTSPATSRRSTSTDTSRCAAGPTTS